MTTIQTIDEATHARERAICDRAAAYAESIMCEGGDTRRRNYLTADEAAAPEYAACDNEMRGRVEQYEILRDLPERIFAYLGEPVGGDFPVTVWTGRPIGKARAGTSWRVWSGYGTRMTQFYARIGGREYTGRGHGSGMCIALRETAESKRKRAAH